MMKGSARMEILTAVRGFKDILPTETPTWRHIEDTARRIFSVFGFQEIRVPILEKTDLFTRGIGESTDIVEKEMYTFQDRGEESLTLRPEATASVIRAYLEHAFHASDNVTKLFTVGPMFRRERPQKGRYRQFHQIDAEILGPDDAHTDAELILMLIHFLRALGLSNLTLEINSLGCPECRPAFREAILAYLRGREDQLCGDCRRRLATNPLRVFDCKIDQCGKIISQAPKLTQFICQACCDHFEKVQHHLRLFDLSFHLNDKMVRGLDYYTRTTFEVTTECLGTQNAVVGGGRYDHLVQELGGPDIPGIGFAIGFERLVAMMPGEIPNTSPSLYIAALGEQARERAFLIGNRLRCVGISVEMDHAGRSLKSQMKKADRLKCNYALIIGERELQEKRALLRDMAASTQEEIRLDQFEEMFINRVR